MTGLLVCIALFVALPMLFVLWRQRLLVAYRGKPVPRHAHATAWPYRLTSGRNNDYFASYRGDDGKGQGPDRIAR